MGKELLLAALLAADPPPAGALALSENDVDFLEIFELVIHRWPWSGEVHPSGWSVPPLNGQAPKGPPPANPRFPPRPGFRGEGVVVGFWTPMPTGSGCFLARARGEPSMTASAPEAKAATMLPPRPGHRQLTRGRIVHRIHPNSRVWLPQRQKWRSPWGREY